MLGLGRTPEACRRLAGGQRRRRAATGWVAPNTPTPAGVAYRARSPEKGFVEGDLVPFQQVEILVLKRALSVMLILRGDGPADRRDVRTAHHKCTVSLLRHASGVLDSVSHGPVGRAFGAGHRLICGTPPACLILYHTVRWRRAFGAGHRLICGTPPACFGRAKPMAFS